MKRIAYISTIAAAAGLLGTSLASADIMQTATPLADSWQPFPATLNNYSNANRPYWDNPSADLNAPGGSPLNIGNYLKGPFSGDPWAPTAVSPDITPNWWGGTGAQAATMDLNMNFNRGTSVGPITAIDLAESAGNANINVVGWYDASNPSDKTVIWTGPDSPSSGATQTFTPTTNWGFYLIGASGVTYYMDAALNTSDSTHQHFSIFQTDSTAGAEIYDVGIEDVNPGVAPIEGNGDFNDFIFSFSSIAGGGNPTPEPASLSLLALGALGLLLRRRK